MDSREEKSNKSLFKRFGKWAPIIGGIWIALNILIPLALLRVPVVQKYLVELKGKLPFDFNWIG